MKYARLLLIFAVLLTSGHATLSAAASADEAEAKAVLLRYFDALTQGDTSTMRSLLGGDLLQKRSRLLNNPSYPDHLVGTYGQARYQIIRSTVVGEDSLAIDAVIELSADDRITKRFLLTRESRAGSSGVGHYIHDEKIVNP